MLFQFPRRLWDEFRDAEIAYAKALSHFRLSGNENAKIEPAVDSVFQKRDSFVHSVPIP